eukprot:5409401-Prorocentrum_lima.AAC.1
MPLSQGMSTRRWRTDQLEILRGLHHPVHHDGPHAVRESVLDEEAAPDGLVRWALFQLQTVLMQLRAE